MANELTEIPQGVIKPEIKRIGVNTAEPPAEVTTIMSRGGLPSDAIEGWLAVPSIMPPIERLPIGEIQQKGQVDAYELLIPLLGNRILDGTLRTIDVLNGCGHRCDTCLADSALPSRMFSYDSLERLFSDDRFLGMLQPDSIRFGSSGDILDHPQGVEIIKMALQKTLSLDAKRQTESAGKERFKIKIFTNYRPKTESQLDELIALAEQYPERVRLTISLPFNKNDAVNRKFTGFVEARPGVFKDSYTVGEDGLLETGYGSTHLRNVGVQDIRHPRLLFMIGRVLSKEANASRVAEYDMVEGDRETSFRDRGLVKTYLNADALWLMIYATPYESHTSRVFTPITPQNIDVLSKLPYHHDFPTPPNWSGGTGHEKSWSIAQNLKAEAKRSGKLRRAYTVVH